MHSKFKGDVALVTGGSSGIGRATALAFARDGAKVVVASRRTDQSEETVHLIEAAGGQALFVRTDMKKPAEIAALVARTVEHFGKLDYAFNNAGTEGDPFVPLAELSEATWDEVIAVNLTAVFLCMKHEIPHILETKGAIVNMASVAGLTGGRVGTAYFASKHGVVGLTRAAAIEYAAQDIRINAVAPAVIRTDMTQRAFFHDEALGAQVTAMHPMGRVGKPEEVAEAVIWLCSKAASFTTGHVLPIDGGRLVR
jgi:Dehydrogenases with different specificities (related to short-chain alcohol dehydrogenases)